MWFKTFGHLIEAKDDTSLETLSIDQLRSTLSDYRAVLLRGFASDAESFREFSGKFSTHFLRHYSPALRPSTSVDATIAGVLVGNQKVNLHGEMYYFPVRPDILFFHCAVPAAKDGETTLCDPIEFYSTLGPDLRRLFERKRIRYVHRMTLDELHKVYQWKSAHEAIQGLLSQGFSSATLADDQNTVTFDFITSAFVKTRIASKPAFLNSIVNVAHTVKKTNKSIVRFEDGEEISPQIIRELDSIGEGICEKVKWKAGDILIVDNSTLLHGRSAFSDERAINTRFATCKDWQEFKQ